MSKTELLEKLNKYIEYLNGEYPDFEHNDQVMPVFKVVQSIKEIISEIEKLP